MTKSKSTFPQLIHYIWLGGDIPEKFLLNIEKVKSMYPKYKVIIWDEKKLEKQFGKLTDHKFVKKAFDSKKYAFAADYFRIKLLWEFGGAYLDVDMIPVKTLCELEKADVIFTFEFSKMVSTSIMIAKPKMPIFKKMIGVYDLYNEERFANADFFVNNKLLTYFLKKDNNLVTENKFQKLKIENVILYPRKVLCSDKAYEETYFIHDHTVSWANPIYKIIVKRGIKFLYRNENRIKGILNKIEKGYWRKLKKNFNNEI